VKSIALKNCSIDSLVLSLWKLVTGDFQDFQCLPKLISTSLTTALKQLVTPRILRLTTSCPENRPTENNVNDPEGGTNVLIHENHALVWAASAPEVSVTSKAMGTYSTVCSYFENGLLCMACLLLLLAACSMLTSL